MPTVAELDRLQALVDRLTPLARTVQGELIRASAWNDLVGTVIELARAVLASAQDEAIPPHTHTEQVGLAWLDPRLRTLIESGPLADPNAAGRLASVERELARTRDRFTTIDLGVREVRDRVTEISTRDVRREADVTETRRRIDAIADARDEITSMRATLASIHDDVAAAIDVGHRLSVDGAPLDAAALLDRLAEVEAVHERLRAPTGELLDAAAFARRLAELENTLVTQEALDDALNRRRPRLNAAEKDSMMEELRTELTTSLTTSLDRTADDLRAEMVARLGDMDARVSTAIADAAPGIRDSVITSVQSDFDAKLQAASAATRTQAVADAETRARSIAQQEARTAADQVAADLTAAMDKTFAVLSNDVTAMVNRSVDTLTSDMNALLNRSLDALSNDLTRTMTGMLSQEVNRLEREFKTALGSVQQTLPRLVQAEFQNFQPRLDAMVDASVRRHMG